MPSKFGKFMQGLAGSYARASEKTQEQDAALARQKASEVAAMARLTKQESMREAAETRKLERERTLRYEAMLEAGIPAAAAKKHAGNPAITDMLIKQFTPKQRTFYWIDPTTKMEYSETKSESELPAFMQNLRKQGVGPDDMGFRPRSERQKFQAGANTGLSHITTDTTPPEVDPKPTGLNPPPQQPESPSPPPPSDAGTQQPGVITEEQKQEFAKTMQEVIKDPKWARLTTQQKEEFVQELRERIFK